jgi:hypothetical protein
MTLVWRRQYDGLLCVCVRACVPSLRRSRIIMITSLINPNFAHRVHSAYWWSCPWEIGGTVSFILSLGRRRKWMTSFTPRPFYLWGNDARYRLSLSRHFRERQFIAFLGNLTMIGQLSSPWPNHYTNWAVPPSLLRCVNCKTNSFFSTFPLLDLNQLASLFFLFPNVSCFSKLFHCSGGVLLGVGLRTHCAK